jgi:hypothetical protein
MLSVEDDLYRELVMLEMGILPVANAGELKTFMNNVASEDLRKCKRKYRKLARKAMTPAELFDLKNRPSRRAHIHRNAIERLIRLKVAELIARSGS